MAVGFTPNDSSSGSGFTPNANSSVPKEMADPGGLAGGNLSKETLDKYRSSAKAMRAAAEGGGFMVSEDIGDAYINAWTKFNDNLDRIRADINIAATPAPLGGDPYAKLIAEHSAKSARGGADSFEAAIDALEIIAKEAIAAFKAAKRSYAEMEATGERVFTNKEMFGE